MGRPIIPTPFMTARLEKPQTPIHLWRSQESSETKMARADLSALVAGKSRPERFATLRGRATIVMTTQELRVRRLLTACRALSEMNKNRLFITLVRYE
jgi:hypothetical protein